MKGDNLITMDTKELVFCTVVYPVRSSEINAVLLAESLRAFAGKFSGSDIWVFMPDYGEQPSEQAVDRLHRLGVKIVPFEIDRADLKLFFMSEINAVAIAESMAVDKHQIVVWMDSNTVVLREPAELELPGKFQLGYRPVHHLLVGSRFDQPLDPFWSLVYQICNVPKQRVFPMKPVVEDLQMRPYFNAGILVSRPQNGLFGKWKDTFVRNYRNVEFQPFYEKDRRYSIFLHQAILSAVILSIFDRDELLELPWTYNYPLHLFDKDQTEMRPDSLEELVTFRHEGFHQQASWRDRIPAGDALKHWLAAHIL
jgi:hypothetical protein